MKKLFVLILALLMLCSCSPSQEPEKPAEPPKEQPSFSEPEEQPEEKEEQPSVKTHENLLEKFEATDIQEIRLFNDNIAYVHSFNREIDLGDGFKTTVSSFDLETAEAEILFYGSAYFDYGDTLSVHKMDFGNPWIFTGKNIFSKGITERGDIEYSFEGSPGDFDFDFGNKRYIFVDGNGKEKLYSKNIETGEEKLLFDVSGEGEHRFIHNPKVNSDSGNIVFLDCKYEASVTVRLICIDFLGNIIFEESFENDFLYNIRDLRWLNEEKFVLLLANAEEQSSSIRIYNINSGFAEERTLDFLFNNIQNDITESYPFAVISEYVPQSHFRYRLWLYDFEEGAAEELYISPIRGIIHGFDLSPGGKTLCWIENDDIKFMEIN
ncbi:MAG: hypothetical protein IJ945_07285 [Oscillospiraceae bacterium]|nr:hypothetical protein [Oscillospiraceae bacterium]